MPPPWFDLPRSCPGSLASLSFLPWLLLPASHTEKKKTGPSLSSASSTSQLGRFYSSSGLQGAAHTEKRKTEPSLSSASTASQLGPWTKKTIKRGKKKPNNQTEKKTRHPANGTHGIQFLCPPQISLPSSVSLDSFTMSISPFRRPMAAPTPAALRLRHRHGRHLSAIHAIPYSHCLFKRPRPSFFVDLAPGCHGRRR